MCRHGIQRSERLSAKPWRPLRPRKVTGSSLQFLYQQSQALFADRAIEAECSLPERYLTADTESLRDLSGQFWLYGSGIKSDRKSLGTL